MRYVSKNAKCKYILKLIKDNPNSHISLQKITNEHNQVSRLSS